MGPASRAVSACDVTGNQAAFSGSATLMFASNRPVPSMGTKDYSHVDRLVNGTHYD